MMTAITMAVFPECLTAVPSQSPVAKSSDSPLSTVCVVCQEAATSPFCCADSCGDLKSHPRMSVKEKRGKKRKRRKQKNTLDTKTSLKERN